MNRVKVILFDFSGVIVTDGFWKWMKEHIPDKVEIARDFFKEKIVKWDRGDISVREEVQKFAEMINVPFETIWQGTIDNFTPNTELLRVIVSLKSKYKIVIFSNFPNELFNELKEKHKLEHYFDEFFISSDYHLVKPEPKIYQVVLSELKIQSNECVFIDDKEENVEAAEKLGISSILYRNLRSLRNDLQIKKAALFGRI